MSVRPDYEKLLRACLRQVAGIISTSSVTIAESNIGKTINPSRILVRDDGFDVVFPNFDGSERVVSFDVSERSQTIIPMRESGGVKWATPHDSRGISTPGMVVEKYRCCGSMWATDTGVKCSESECLYRGGQLLTWKMPHDAGLGMQTCTGSMAVSEAGVVSCSSTVGCRYTGEPS